MTEVSWDVGSGPMRQLREGYPVAGLSLDVGARDRAVEREAGAPPQKGDSGSKNGLSERGVSQGKGRWHGQFPFTISRDRDAVNRAAPEESKGDGVVGAKGRQIVQ